MTYINLLTYSTRTSVESHTNLKLTGFVGGVDVGHPVVGLGTGVDVTDGATLLAVKEFPGVARVLALPERQEHFHSGIKNQTAVFSCQ